MDIKGYIVTVICVCVVASIVTLLTPEGDGERGRTVRFALGVIMIIASISPIKAVIEGIYEINISGITENFLQKEEEYESIFQEELASFEEENLKSGIRKLLNEKFNIEPSECYVEVMFEEKNGERRLKRVFITLYSSAIWSDTGAIEAYFGELLSCEILTAVGR